MKSIAVAAVLGVAVALGGCAATGEDAAAQKLAQLPPWEAAQATLDAATADMESTGMAGVQPYVAALEQALAAAPSVLTVPQYKGTEQVVLADGLMETSAAAASPAKGKVVVANPYPAIALMLGRYYLHENQPAEALRVLDAGVALPGAVKGVQLGKNLWQLYAERGAVLGQMQRWSQAVASYDRGLRLPGLSAAERVRLLHGRALALIELKRLDEADIALNNVLRLEPGNAQARQDRLYIAALRAGMTPAAARAVSTGQPVP